MIIFRALIQNIDSHLKNSIMKKIFTFFSLLFIYNLAIAQDACNNYWSAISPDGNHIYFSSDRDGGKFEIYRVDIDGSSNPVRLTNDDTVDKLYPAISYDGSLIVFQYGNYGSTAEVYIMNNDGTNLTQLTDNGVYDGYPNFSPNGTKIVFDAWDNTDYPEIFTMNIDGTDRIQLTNETGAYWQSAPIYNPSGTKIIMSKGFNADNHFVQMDLDGSNRVDITPYNDPLSDMDSGLHFNADGSKIAFYTNEYAGGYNTGCDIVTADADGLNWIPLTHSTYKDCYAFPFFHPTNGKIYYSFNPGGTGTWSIYKMDLDGSNPEKISTCTSVGIDENFDLSKKLIYPNPAKSTLNIDFEGEFSLEIYDLTARLVLKSKTKKTDISQLKQGIYMVSLKDSNERVIKVEKLVKSE